VLFEDLGDGFVAGAIGEGAVDEDPVLMPVFDADYAEADSKVPPASAAPSMAAR
jgi:hypothetical protein